MWLQACFQYFPWRDLVSFVLISNSCESTVVWGPIRWLLIASYVKGKLVIRKKLLFLISKGMSNLQDQQGDHGWFSSKPISRARSWWIILERTQGESDFLYHYSRQSNKWGLWFSKLQVFYWPLLSSPSNTYFALILPGNHGLEKA